MDRIWAPWRGPYVRAIPDATGCFLCEAVGQPDPRAALIVGRRREVFAIMNRYPFTTGHVMVAPFTHAAMLADLPETTLSELMVAARDLCAVLRDAFRAEGFNVGFNLGRAGGAGLKDHLHLHVIPRWPGDANFMVVLNDTRVINQSLEAQWEELSARLGEKWR